jgi:hypothetical protein
MDGSLVNSDQKTLVDIHDRHKDWLRAQPGVVRTSVGLGQGGNLAIKIFFDKNLMTDQVRQAISKRLSGAPIEYVEWDPGESIRPQ